MIFIVEDSTHTNPYFIKDDKGYIIGCVTVSPEGWVSQSCVKEDEAKSWSLYQGPFATKMEAVNAAIADYIARRME